ncbi:hypothetical protein BpHYR1_039545, partial [Brachionus plicatilis]
DKKDTKKLLVIHYHHVKIGLLKNQDVFFSEIIQKTVRNIGIVAQNYLTYCKQKSGIRFKATQKKLF